MLKENFVYIWRLHDKTIGIKLGLRRNIINIVKQDQMNIFRRTLEKHRCNCRRIPMSEKLIGESLNCHIGGNHNDYELVHGGCGCGVPNNGEGTV